MTERADVAPIAEFPRFAESVLARTLVRHPVEATYLGEHRHDHLLDDPSPEAAERRAAELRAQLDDLEGITPGSRDEGVDAAVLRTALCAELFGLAQIGEAEWNPMEHNPGPAIHALTSRDFAPLAERVEPLVARLAAVPEYLAAARDRLGTMSRVHVETALIQLDGTAGLIDSVLPDVLAAIPSVQAVLEPAADAARDAVRAHRDWLAVRLDDSTRDPRLGPELFTAKLALTLDTEFDPAALLARAEADLERVTADIIAESGRIDGAGAPGPGTVRSVLDRLAADAPTDETILGLCRDAFDETTAFVREHDLVTVYDDPVAVVEMPEIDRGVAVAYCRPPGPLETASLPTEFAVSPTPIDWDRDQVASFYREYNTHMLHNLTVHEAMPGHALQLMHSNRFRAPTPVRAIWWSGSFVEGWAVYAEQLMADRGYRRGVGPGAASAVRMQQLKMQLRMIINAIMDVRFHCSGLDESEAMELMQVRGFQEQAEAAGKWRRVQLTSTQLSTYYVGYCEVRDLATDLHAARPELDDRRVHDAILAHGSPPVRHLRTLLLDPDAAAV